MCQPHTGLVGKLVNKFKMAEWVYKSIKCPIRLFKQAPLAQYTPDLLITCANLARQVTFFSKKAFGECVEFDEYPKCSRQVWQI